MCTLPSLCVRVAVVCAVLAMATIVGCAHRPPAAGIPDADISDGRERMKEPATQEPAGGKSASGWAAGTDEQLAETIRHETAEQTIEHLADFDDVGTADASMSSMPNVRFYGARQVIVMSRLARVRRLLSEPADRVVPLLRKAFAAACSGADEAGRAHDRRLQASGGTMTESGPSDWDKRQMTATASLYILTQLGDYQSLPLFTRALSEMGAARVETVVPRDMALYAICNLLRLLPRDGLSAAQREELDRCLKAADLAPSWRLEFRDGSRMAGNNHLMDRSAALAKQVGEFVGQVFAKGAPRVEDAAVVWAKNESPGIQLLRSEPFEQGLYRLYDKSELLQVDDGMTSKGNFGPETISVMVRTRRFSKLIDEVDAARNTERMAQRVNGLRLVAHRFFDEHEKVARQMEALLKQHPGAANLDGVKGERFGDLLSGHPLSGIGPPPEKFIPMSLNGVQRGMTGVTFFLGYTESPPALDSLLEIAHHDASRLGSALAAASGDKNWSGGARVQNWYVLGDALDRVLVAIAKDAVDSPSRTVARQYLSWRDERKWPAREKVVTFAYDEPLNPFGYGGIVAAAAAEPAAPHATIELPLVLAPAGRESNGKEPNVSKIIEWAERVQHAGSGAGEMKK